MARACTYTQLKLCNNVIRSFSTKTSSNLKTDTIGPPDPISNLRPVKFARRKNESHFEEEYRKAREDTQLWNQNFWTKHNTSFIEERKQFQELLKSHGKTSFTADDMSVFYKYFLDKNWKSHFDYNIMWYKKNIKLLILEFKVLLLDDNMFCTSNNSVICRRVAC
ncbi:cytochrome c oxidase assembly factor 8 isoform X2 [Colletes latitarsis]|uniref:cytochrome c oxidase assembly factor 8 isoform X2 n=1 Tax=Colletes latitarsis TaxID=2605962 RepID=UPI004036099F